MGYFIITILKVLVGLAGIALSLVYFLPGMANRDKKKTVTGIIIFVSTFVLLVIVTVIELIVIIKLA